MPATLRRHAEMTIEESFELIFPALNVLPQEQRVKAALSCFFSF